MADTLKTSSDFNDNIADEIYITKKLIEEINNYNNKSSNLFKRLQEATGLYINIRGWENKKAHEKKVGSDLGIVLNILGYNYQVQKAIIVQSKKGFYEKGRILYKELIKKERGKIKGIKQAKKMLEITPSSFFFLYNNSDFQGLDIYEPILQQHFFKSKKIFSEKLLKDKDLYLDDIFRFLFRNKKIPIDIFSFPIITGQYLKDRMWEQERKSYSGIFVLPASKIGSIKENLDGTLETLLPSSLCFADFMVDLFLPCFVGDCREDVIKKSGAKQEFFNAITRYTIEMKASLG